MFPFLRTRDAIHESDGTGRTGKGCGLAASVMVGADRGMLARGQMLRQYPTEVHHRTDCCVPRNGDLRPHFPLIVSPLFISKNFRVCVCVFSSSPLRLRDSCTMLPLKGGVNWDICSMVYR